jgi:hypothetical protein
MDTSPLSRENHQPESLIHLTRTPEESHELLLQV